MTTPQLNVKQLFDRESCTYTYLLIDSDTGEGAIIDAVLETFDRDMQIINELGGAAVCDRDPCARRSHHLGG